MGGQPGNCPPNVSKTCLVDTYSIKLQSFCYDFFFNTWRPAAFGDFRKKTHQNAHDFAWELLHSCTGYRPGRSVKRCGKSSSLHLKEIFWFGGADFCEWCHKWRNFRPPWPTPHSCVAEAKKEKENEGKMLHNCNLLCISPKHGTHGSLRCLKIIYIHNCLNLLFCPWTVVKLRWPKIIQLQNRLFLP